MAISQTPKQGRAWAEARRGGEDGSQGWRPRSTVFRDPHGPSQGASPPSLQDHMAAQLHRDWLGRSFGQGSEQKCRTTSKQTRSEPS